MYLNIDKYGNHSVVPVRCGRSRGTAFFIKEGMLMTAKHVLGPYINNPTGCNIQINIGDNWENCTLAYKFETADIALLNCNVSRHLYDVLDLVESDCYENEDLMVVGFPQEIGNGIDYFGVNIRNSRHLRKSDKDNLSRGFNVVAIRTDQLAFVSYAGFSGSPVLNAHGRVVGIATDQFYNSLGYTSIKAFQEIENFELSKHGVTVMFDDQDMSPYGLGTCNALLDEVLKKAGARYTPDNHVESKRIDDVLEAFCHIGIEEKEQELYSLIKKLFLNAKDKLKEYLISKDKDHNGNVNPTILQKYIFDRKLSYGLLTAIEEVQYYRGDHSSGSLLINPLRKDVEKAYEITQELLGMQEFIDAKFMYVTGNAGQGKTHALCHFADIHRSLCAFYLFYGTDFSDKEPLETILAKLKWLEDDLQKLNDFLSKKNRYAIFIIDGVNEGTGTEYWYNNIEILQEKLEGYDRIKLIVSFRTMPDTDVLRDKMRSELQLEIPGFENTKDAIDTFLKEKCSDDERKNYAVLPEFRSPLYLKIFSEVYASRYSFAKQIARRDEVYMLFLKKRNLKISEKVDEDPLKNVTTEYVLNISRKSQEERLCYDIDRGEAAQMAEDLCPNRMWSHNLMNVLLQENILKEYGLRNGGYYIGFEYDSIGDYLKMRWLLNMSDELILQYVSDGLQKFSRHGLSYLKNSSFGNMLTFLFAEWTPSKDTWDKVLKQPNAETYFMKSLALRKDDNIIVSEVVMELIDKDAKYSSPENILDNFDVFKHGVIEHVHKKLLNMPLSERDLRWTIEVNALYGRHGIISRIDNLYHTQEEYYDDLSLLLCWFFTSSYNVLRSKIVMYLRDIYRKNPELIVKNAERVTEINDPYVLQGLFSAAYAALVLNRDSKVCETVAKTIVDTYYKDKKSAPSDLVVRHWTMKIVELSSILNNGCKYWDALVGMMPFDSNENPFAKINDTEKYDNLFFGTTPGAHSIYHSLFTWDFARYIIGTNNYSYSPIFVDPDSDIKNAHNLGHEGDVSLADIQKAIAHLIRDKYIYSENIGEIDKTIGYVNRHEHGTERIGKKYQWLGYFEVLSYLCDHYKILLNRWSSNTRFAEYSFPWLTNEVPRMDPTINLEESLSILSERKFGLIPNDFNDVEFADKWLEDDSLLPSMHLEIEDIEHRESWVTLKAFDTQSALVDNKDCSTTCWYHSVFIRKSDETRFEDWCKGNHYRQDFLGSGNYEYHWNSYPDTSDYKERGYKFNLEEDWGAPCDVMDAVSSQLQEDFTGCYSEHEHLREAFSPNVSVMEALKLHNAERGVVRNAKNEIVALNINPTTSRISGLVMRRKDLDIYLKEGYVLYIFISVNKQLTTSTFFIGEHRYHGLYKYEAEKSADCIIEIAEDPKFEPKVQDIKDDINIDKLLAEWGFSNKDDVENV